MKNKFPLKNENSETGDVKIFIQIDKENNLNLNNINIRKNLLYDGNKLNQW